MKTFAELVNSPWFCRFSHDWGKWEWTREGVKKTVENKKGEHILVGQALEYKRVCNTCGLPQHKRIKSYFGWDSNEDRS